MKVDFEDRKYWKTHKCNNWIKLVDFLAKSTSDILCNFVFIFHWDDGVISMTFYPIWPVIYAQSNSTSRISNSTGHEILVKLGGNSLRLHLYACLIKLGIIPVIPHPIWGGNQILSPPVEFDRAWNTGQIGWKFIVCLPWSNCVSSQWIQLASISMDLLPIQPFEFDRALITGKNGCKFTEITFVCLPGRIAGNSSLRLLRIPHYFYWKFFTGNSSLLHISMDLLPIRPVEFDRA